MKSYFNFSKGQKTGVIALAIIIIIQIIFLNKKNGLGLSNPFLVDASQYEIIEKGNTYKKEFKNKKYELSIFDPNKYNQEDWEGIGFSPKQAKIIVNFKDRIGGFKTNKDIEKVFVISNKKFKELEPFLKIKKIQIENSFNFNEKNKIEKPLIIYELNTATIQELISIKGIGEFTVNAIQKHKAKIGGFHSVKQLKEIYGIEDDNYDKIIKQLTVDASTLVKVNVNELSIFDLKKHHYISWNTAEAIINKRLMGKISNIDFLVSDNILTQEKLEILLPYLEY